MNCQEEEGILISAPNGTPTAIYSGILTRTGECHFGLGDMTAHSYITPQLLYQHSAQIRSAPIVILDGNIPSLTLGAALEMCQDFRVPG